MRITFLTPLFMILPPLRSKNPFMRETLASICLFHSLLLLILLFRLVLLPQDLHRELARHHRLVRHRLPACLPMQARTPLMSQLPRLLQFLFLVVTTRSRKSSLKRRQILNLLATDVPSPIPRSTA